MALDKPAAVIVSRAGERRASVVLESPADAPGTTVAGAESTSVAVATPSEVEGTMSAGTETDCRIMTVWV